MIRRVITREQRLFEIIESMPKPNVMMNRSLKGIQTIKVTAINEGGICLYTYTHSGTIGMNSLLAKLLKYIS